MSKYTLVWKAENGGKTVFLFNTKAEKKAAVKLLKGGQVPAVPAATLKGVERNVEVAPQQSSEVEVKQPQISRQEIEKLAKVWGAKLSISVGDIAEPKPATVNKEIVSENGQALNFSSVEEAKAYIRSSALKGEYASAVDKYASAYKLTETVFVPKGLFEGASDANSVLEVEHELVVTSCQYDSTLEEQDEEEYYDEDDYCDVEEYVEPQLVGQSSNIAYNWGDFMRQTLDGLEVLKNLPGAYAVATKWNPMYTRHGYLKRSVVIPERYAHLFPLNKKSRKLLPSVSFAHLVWAHALKITDPNLLCKLWEGDIIFAEQEVGSYWNVYQTVKLLMEFGISLEKLLSVCKTKVVSVTEQGETFEREIAEGDFEKITKALKKFKKKGQTPNFSFRWTDFYKLQRELKTQSLKLEPLVEFSYTDKQLAIESRQIGGLKFKLPKTNHELALWGEEQRHCVGGYTPNIIIGSTLIFAVIEKGEHKWTAEWDCQNHCYVQCQAAGNQGAPDYVWEAIKQLDI